MPRADEGAPGTWAAQQKSHLEGSCDTEAAFTLPSVWVKDLIIRLKRQLVNLIRARCTVSWTTTRLAMGAAQLLSLLPPRPWSGLPFPHLQHWVSGRDDFSAPFQL